MSECPLGDRGMRVCSRQQEPSNERADVTKKGAQGGRAGKTEGRRGGPPGLAEG